MASAPTQNGQSPKGLSNDVLLVSVPTPPNETWMEHLRASHPGLTVRWFTQSYTYPPAPVPEEVYEGVTLLVTFWPHPAESLPNVRYIQLLSAGADRWITHDLYKNPKITFCTANGAHSYVSNISRA
jgi:hypothetical protein